MTLSEALTGVTATTAPAPLGAQILDVLALLLGHRHLVNPLVHVRWRALASWHDRPAVG